MKTTIHPIYIGETPQKNPDKKVRGSYVTFLGEPFYKIENFDAIEPFFMSIVSASNHWLFISSTGGLSAGRINAENAIFPYYNVDKITENSENTGNKAIFLINRSGRVNLWEPLSPCYMGVYAIKRSIYKNIPSTAVVFEEINLDLKLTYRYVWRTSEKFGFIKTSWLINNDGTGCEIEVLDGIQNILPAFITETTQNVFSSLLDAYKHNELDPCSGMAIYALNSQLTDLAEPSEALLATTVAQLGLPKADYLLSSAQLERFHNGKFLETETEVRGQRGAYFVHTQLQLEPAAELSWHILAEVNQDSAAIVQKMHWLKGKQADLIDELECDIAAGQQSLWKLIASADGLQLSTNQVYAAHHFANVMFNLMRGGIFSAQYEVQSSDFKGFISHRSHKIEDYNPGFFASLPEKIQLSDLQAGAEASGSPDLIRLSYAYLPLIFSRRHGDPTRPWNRFAINIKKPDGSIKIDYEGNWRDILQNWEALAFSFPEFVESMIFTFLNATTADGYNPYRLTHHGIDWEIPEPHNPWANIGYWSDHQIIYLQKLMEISSKIHPGKLEGFLGKALFSYANVPYRIKPYDEILKDPYNTIIFDWDLENQISGMVNKFGMDGKLIFTANGQEVLKVSLAEKLLTLLLAKLVNFIPEGGIWMNTQRPEWNDANNALVGKGLSVVTLGYLRRYLVFCRKLFQQTALKTVPISIEVQKHFTKIYEILKSYQTVLSGHFTNEQRRTLMDYLGNAGSEYRWEIYRNSFSGDQAETSIKKILALLELALRYVEHTLRANKRQDNLYHSYNVLHFEQNYASISHLYEMLEGQVAILSSGLLSGEESLALLQSLRDSPLYQPDQHSYLLYPDRQIPGFLQKNCLSQDRVGKIALFNLLLEDRDSSLITRDASGYFHFNGKIRNFRDVKKILDKLNTQPRYGTLVEMDYEKIQVLFEDTFHHNEFTGRSGTFFAFEGLGSVYWHMVAKLLLATQETVARFSGEATAAALRERYFDIRQGFGFNKSPEKYGAFPTDPYSHTPKGQVAKQPGMTGMVKEVILTRQVELGLSFEDGQLVFNLFLLDPRELLIQPSEFSYLDVNEQEQKIALETGSLAYTFCQTPIVLQANRKNGFTGITIFYADGSQQLIEGNALDTVTSQHIFMRDGKIQLLHVEFDPRKLK